MPRWILRHPCGDEPYIECPRCTAPICFFRDCSRQQMDGVGRPYYDFDPVYVVNLDPWSIDTVRCWCRFVVGQTVDGIVRLKNVHLVPPQFPDHGFYDDANRGLQNEFVFNHDAGYDPCCVWKCGGCSRQFLDYPTIPNEFTTARDLVNVYVSGDRIFCRCGLIIGCKGIFYVDFVPTVNAVKAFSLVPSIN